MNWSRATCSHAWPWRKHHVFNWRGRGDRRKDQEFLSKAWIYTDANGEPLPARNLVQEDILIVTAHNAKFKYLKSLMNKNGWNRIAVDIFDKFQGREAPVVLVSMVTLTAEDLPRGIELLLSPSRLNVAVSRAKCACYIVRSASLSIMQPSSTHGMFILGKFVRLCSISSWL